MRGAADNWGWFILVLALFAGLGCAGKEWRPEPMSDEQAQAVAAKIGLSAPVNVDYWGKVADGGSQKGELVDKDGKFYPIFRQRALSKDVELKWYVGEDWNSGRAEYLPPGDERIDAIVNLLIDWVDRTVPYEEQLRIRELPVYEMDLRTMTQAEIRQAEAQHLILTMFMRERWH